MTFYYIALGNSGTYSPSLVSEDTERRLPCPSCGRVKCFDGDQDVTLELERKKTIPDQLLCGAKPSLFILSERALDVFERNHVTGYRALGKITLLDKHGQLITDYPQQYYNVTITGACCIDYAAMGVAANVVCNSCALLDYVGNTWQLPEPGPYIKEWDGSDLCHMNGFPHSPMCTSRLAKIIVSNKLSNFSFYDINDYFYGSRPEIKSKEILKAE